MNKDEIRLSILRYLSKNPKAEDTLEAVVLWWILKDRCELRTTQVETVTQQLVDEGLLLEKKGPRYAVNPERLHEVFNLVQDAKQPQ